MKNKPLVLLVLAPLSFGATVSAQSPTPTASPNPPCPLGFGWAEGLVAHTA